MLSVSDSGPTLKIINKPTALQHLLKLLFWKIISVPRFCSLFQTINAQQIVLLNLFKWYISKKVLTS